MSPLRRHGLVRATVDAEMNGSDGRIRFSGPTRMVQARKAQISASPLSPRWRAAVQLNKGNHPKPSRGYRRKFRP